MLEMAAKIARSGVMLLQIFIIILVQNWIKAQENSLNAPQVLLPYTPTDAVPANYTLKAARGCFRWSSSKPEVAMVTPLYDFDPISCQGYSLGEKIGENSNKKCSTSAAITASSTSREKQTAVVIAEEESSGILLRCDVFVDTIYRIEIATTTRELLLGESPEVFDVYGYDEEGNLFSSLGSTNFDWYLSPVPANDTVDPSTVLRFLQFEGSSYETTPEIHSLEQKGQRGSSVIMMGINTGEALVSAKLVHPAYKDVAPSTVRLMVVDNIILQPSLDVYILVGTKVIYKVKQLRRGQQKEIAVPSPQYRFQLTNEDIATWNHEESSVTGKAYGETKVILIDNNVAHTKSARQPSATVHVAEPGFLGFAISPGNVWVLETGRKYTINVEIFDFKKHKIVITDNTILKSMFPEEHFELKFQSTNNSFNYVKAIKVGRREINATLIGVQTEDGTNFLNMQPAISGEQIVDIFDPIKIVPNLVIFPCEPALASESLYTVQLKAFGGSGYYQWNSDQYSIATVTNKGLVKAGGVLGIVKIRARDLKNLEHYGEATIMVLPPDEMHFLPTPVEAEIGQSLVLSLSVSAYVDIEGKNVLRVFEDCKRMSLGKSLSDETIFTFTDSQIEGSKLQDNSCTRISLKAIKSGFTTLTVTYRADNVVLKASITVGAYEPLVVIDPADVATVTLGSSEIVALAGGPQPWILDPNGFYESLSAEEDEWVAIQKSDRNTRLASAISRSDNHLFKVTCRQITEIQLLTGQVGNKPTPTNQFPASSVTKLRFLCTPPGSLTLKPDIVLPVIDGHQMTLEGCQDADKNIPVRNNRELTIFLVVRDASGQVFDNASSLDIKWSSSSTDLVKITHKHSQSVRVKGNFSVTVSQTILLSSNTGPVMVEATVSDYKEVDLYAIGIYDEGLKQQAKIYPPISGSLGLHLVNERSLTPSQLTLFSHSKNMAQLSISDGSKHFKVKVNDDSLADIQTVNSAIEVTPRLPGRLALSVYDICLDSERPARADVKLADIHTIQVIVTDKVELNKFIKAVVQIKDADSNSLSVSDMKLMKLTPKFSASIIESRPDHDSPDSKSAFSTKATYLLEGLAVGVTSMTFDAMQANAIIISSKPQDIQVFPPLRLDPKRIIMIVGSTFQVQSIGGPRPQSTVAFEITNQTVAKITNVGIITASVPGNTTIIGLAQGTDPHSGTTIIYSQDIILVEVLRLKGFKIRLPSRVIISDSQIGIYAIGLSDEGPFTFATATPYVKFHWSITNNEVAALKSAYDSTGVKVGNEKDFRVVLSTQRAGQAMIKLRVEITASWIDEIVIPSAILEDEIQVQVFEGLKVLFPEDGEMLLPPNVETKIKTSKDGVARISYEIVKGCSEDTKAAIVDLLSDGHIKTTSTSGIATVLIMSHEDFGFNQTAVINIEVRAVASITMVSQSSVIAFNDNWHSFPIGAHANFAVALHDNVGRKFDVSTIQLKHRVHRFDTITVVPDSNKAVYAIRAVKIGDAVLKVWDEHNADVADYIRIHVAFGIEPSQTNVQHGSMICFKSLVKTFKDAPVTWSVSNPEVFSIDALSGIGIAQSAGTAVVYYDVGDFLTQVQVNVRKTTSLKLLPSESTILTNTVLADTTHIDVPIKIGDDENMSVGFCDKVSTETKDRRLPFTCALISDRKEPVSIKEIFNVRARYLNGRPFCEISPVELPSEVLQEISITNIALHLHVSLLDASQENVILADATYLPFIPAFIIGQKDVQLSSEKLSALVSVFGVAAQLSSLQVTSQDPSRVQVTLPLDSSSKEASVDYEIKLMTDTDVLVNTLSIIFKSGLTGQTAVLKVLIESTPTVKPEHCIPTVVVPDAAITHVNYFRSTAKEYGPWLVLYTILIATVILLIFIYHSFIRRRNQQNSFQPGSPYNPMMTPVPGSAATHTPGSIVRGQSTYRRSPHETTPGVRNLFSIGQ